MPPTMKISTPSICGGKLYLTERDVKYDKELALKRLTCAADQGNEYAQIFLDQGVTFRRPSVMLAATRLLHHVANIFRDNSLPKAGTVGFKLDKKRLQKRREKRWGNCYDNAMTEKFFSILKTECICRHKLKNFDEARTLIDEYIDCYNNERIQTKTSLTPLEKRRQAAQSLAILR